MYHSLLLKGQGARQSSFYIWAQTSQNLKVFVCWRSCGMRIAARNRGREPKLPDSLGIYLLLIPLWVTFWQILRRSKAKKRPAHRRGKTQFLWLGALCPRSCTLKVMHLRLRWARAVAVQKQITFSRAECNPSTVCGRSSRRSATLRLEVKRVPVVMGCAAQGITDRVAQSAEHGHWGRLVCWRCWCQSKTLFRE